MLIPIHFSNAIVNCGSTAGDNADNGGVCHVPPSSNTGRASNSVNVQMEDDEEPYETARAIDSDVLFLLRFWVRSRITHLLRILAIIHDCKKRKLIKLKGVQQLHTNLVQKT